MHELKCRILQVLQVEGDLHIFFFSIVNYTGMEWKLCMLLNAYFYICSRTFGEIFDGD